MNEQPPQPQPDLLTKAQSYDSFDAWLSGIHDERLKQIAEVIGQVEAKQITDEETLMHLLNIAMHFSGNVAMPIPEITKAYQTLALQVGIEINVRNEVISKQGEYSMHPDGGARFTITDKGKEIYHQRLEVADWKD